MKFNEWKRWVKGKPFAFKWFIVFVLLKPCFDFLWDARIFTSISLLQITSGLLPIFIIISLLIIRRKNKAKSNLINLMFSIWVFLYIINIFLVLIFNFSIEVFGLLLKAALPIYIYYFYKRSIINKSDLDGILSTYLFSLVIPVLAFFYNIIFNPSAYNLSRGLERFNAGYADVANLGISVNLGIIIVFYFWLRWNSIGTKINPFKYTLLFGIAVGFTIILGINHAASLAIFICLNLFFIFYILKQKYAFAIITMSLLLFGILFFINKQDILLMFNKLYSTDVEVVEGDKPGDYAFHGRVGRWDRHIDIFTEEPFFAQLFGIRPIEYPFMIGHGTHSDYLRILYSSGYLGLFFYLFFLIFIFIRGLSLNRELKFLTWAVLLFLTLQSITLTPSMYHAVNFIFFAVATFIQLPQIKSKRNSKKIVNRTRGKRRLNQKSRKIITTNQ